MPNYTGVATDQPTLNKITFSNVTGGAISGIYSLTATLSPVAVAANTTAEQTFTVQGLKVGDVVNVNKPTAQAGLGIAGVRVSAANTLAINFVNATAGSITPTASEVYKISGIRV